MSGERLREAATLGNYKLVQRFVGDSCNVCSCDSYGLSALHYAVFNGHVRCVKFLAANPWGVDQEGNRGSCLDMASCKGYTALHLACLECPDESVIEIIRTLLVLGADQDMKDYAGRTPFEYAVQRDDAAREAFLGLDAEMIETIAADLLQNFTFASGRRWTVDNELDARCVLPGFVFDEQQRAPSLPRGLAVHEHHILPLIQEGQSRRGVDALHCLEFAKREADRNRDRRELLLKAYDTSWSPPSQFRGDATTQLSSNRKKKDQGRTARR